MKHPTTNAVEADYNHWLATFTHLEREYLNLDPVVGNVLSRAITWRHKLDDACRSVPMDEEDCDIGYYYTQVAEFYRVLAQAHKAYSKLESIIIGYSEDK